LSHFIWVCFLAINITYNYQNYELNNNISQSRGYLSKKGNTKSQSTIHCSSIIKIHALKRLEYQKLSVHWSKKNSTNNNINGLVESKFR